MTQWTSRTSTCRMDNPSSTLGVPDKQQLLQQLQEIQATLQHRLSENNAHMRAQALEKLTADEIQVPQLYLRAVVPEMRIFQENKKNLREYAMRHAAECVRWGEDTMVSEGAYYALPPEADVHNLQSYRPDYAADMQKVPDDLVGDARVEHIFALTTKRPKNPIGVNRILPRNLTQHQILVDHLTFKICKTIDIIC